MALYTAIIRQPRAGPVLTFPATARGCCSSFSNWPGRRCQGGTCSPLWRRTDLRSTQRAHLLEEVVYRWDHSTDWSLLNVLILTGAGGTNKQAHTLLNLTRLNLCRPSTHTLSGVLLTLVTGLCVRVCFCVVACIFYADFLTSYLATP